MDDPQFAERIAQIRVRFAAKLAEKIKDTDASLQRLAGDGNDAADAVASIYRRFHDIYGIGSTLGFEATGRLARTVGTILFGPFQAHRGLSRDELARLRESFEALRLVARNEMRSEHSG